MSITKKAVISFIEGLLLSYLPLMYATLNHLLPNYLSGIALAIASGILKVIYDNLIKNKGTAN